MNNDLLPDMYVKNIFLINYNKLRKLGIKTLVFDLDNTIVEPGNKLISDEIKILFKKLKQDFNCIVLSNTIKANNIKKLCQEINCEYVFFACKPTLFGFKRAKKLHNSKRHEICMIGDQYFTDIKGAKKVGYYAILVDQIGPHEGIHTKINRIREKNKYKKLNFLKGKYYD